MKGCRDADGYVVGYIPRMLCNEFNSNSGTARMVEGRYIISWSVEADFRIPFDTDFPLRMAGIEAVSYRDVPGVNVACKSDDVTGLELVRGFGVDNKDTVTSRNFHSSRLGVP